PSEDESDTRTIRIELGPLDGTAVTELVSAVLGQRVAELDRTASRAIDHADGVPHFIAAILADVCDGEPIGPGTHGADAEGACRHRIRARIARLPGRSADVLGTLAVLGRS